MFWSREEEKKARGDQASLKDSIEAEKIRTEKDTMKASMEIARLKDDLLESRLTIDHILIRKRPCLYNVRATSLLGVSVVERNYLLKNSK